jgi:hypothetical protein
MEDKGIRQICHMKELFQQCRIVVHTIQRFTIFFSNHLLYFHVFCFPKVP